jgi:hypothetical protein
VGAECLFACPLPCVSCVHVCVCIVSCVLCPVSCVRPRSISVSAERWVPLEEVKEAALLGWLRGKKAAG